MDESSQQAKCSRWGQASIHIRLESAGRRVAFAVGVLLTVIGFGGAAGRVWVAAELATSTDRAGWRRAAQLEPGNAGYWAKLGWREQWELEGGNLEQAAADYERALKAKPHSAPYWLELAEIYERQGELQRAHAAYAMAEFNHPTSSEVAWRYGNFLLRQGEASEAWAKLRRALRFAPGLTGSAVAECRRAATRIAPCAAELLPAETRYYFLALDYLSQRNELDDALGFWDRLVELKQRFELSQATPFVNDLIRAGLAAEAQRVWAKALEITGWPRDAGNTSNLVFNGGFEHDLAPGGFDWREEPVLGARFTFDTQAAHSGRRSLRIDFDGGAAFDFQHLMQYVAVEPGRRYRFAGHLSCPDVSADRDVQFEIADPQHPDLPRFVTSGAPCSEVWTKTEVEFTTGAATHLVRIVLRRLASRKRENKLRGTVWVDDVSLVALEVDNGHLR